VGKSTGSRESAPDDRLRVPTIKMTVGMMVDMAPTRLRPSEG
jgi:hypothetical protein